MQLKEIKQALQEKGPDLFRQYDVDLAYLFGSAARDRLRERSDVDVAIRFKPSLPKDRYFHNLVLSYLQKQSQPPPNQANQNAA